MKTIGNLFQKTLLFFLVVNILISCKNPEKIVEQDVNTVVSSKEGTVQFTGIITAVKNDCWVDSVCSIEVNNEWWIAIVYGKRDPDYIFKERGLASGIRFTEDNESIGKTVKVYAAITDKKRLTLEGDSAYFVEVINN